MHMCILVITLTPDYSERCTIKQHGNYGIGVLKGYSYGSSPYHMGGDQCQNGGSNLEGGDFKLRGGILQVERGYTSS